MRLLPGASSHITVKMQWFKNFRESNIAMKVYLGHDTGYVIKGYGDVPFVPPNGNIWNIHDVMYILGIKYNLISISRITDQYLKVELFKSHCVIKDMLDQMKSIATGVCVRRLYKLDVRSVSHQALASSAMSVENLWHQRFGHINFSDLLLLQKKDMVNDPRVFKSMHVHCEACVLSKLHRDEFPAIVDRNQRYILELVHTDLCGSM